MVKTYFSPEFLNRNAVAVEHHEFGEEHMARIQMRYLEKCVAQMDMKLEVSDAAPMELAREGFDPSYGAHPLKRAVQQQIANPLAKETLSGRFGPKEIIHVVVEDGRIVFEQVIEAEAG